MIVSNNNQQIKALTMLVKKSKERRKQGLFVVEGPKMVGEVPAGWLRAVYYSESFGKNPDTAELFDKLRTLKATKLQQRTAEETEDKEHFIAETGSSFKLEEVSDSVYKSISDTMTPQGIMAVVRMPSYELSQLSNGNRTMLLVLDSVQDPGNLGTMFRTGEGAGVTGVIMNRTTVDLFNPKTIRSTMGSIYRVPFYVAEDLAEILELLRDKGVKLYAAHLKGTHSYDEFDYRGACGFLIGNEGNGLSDEIAALADTFVRIPMEGQVESLNAAVSAALLMYEANRQRRKG